MTGNRGGFWGCYFQARVSALTGVHAAAPKGAEFGSSLGHRNMESIVESQVDEGAGPAPAPLYERATSNVLVRPLFPSGTPRPLASQGSSRGN